MLLFNFSNHPLSGVAVAQLKELGYEIVEAGVLHVKFENPIVPQVEAYVEPHIKRLAVAGYAVLLPGMNSVAAVMLATLHGISGVFPKIATLVRNEEGAFQVGEILDLHTIRNEQRVKRMK